MFDVLPLDILLLILVPHLTIKEVARLAGVNRFFYRLIYGDILNEGPSRLWSALFHHHLSEIVVPSPDPRTATLHYVQQGPDDWSTAVKLGYEKALECMDTLDDEAVMNESICGGHLHIVEYLVSIGVTYKPSFHAMHSMVVHRRLGMIQRHLELIKESGEDLQDAYNDLLQSAAETGQLDIFKQFYALATNQDECIGIALEESRKEIIEYVLSTGTLDQSRINTHFIDAAKESNLEMMEILMKAGANQYMAAISYAAKAGNFDRVLRFVELEKARRGMV